MPPSSTAGNFTCADLVKIYVTIDRAWKDNQTNTDFIPYVEALRVIKERQTASLPELENAEKDETVEVYWATDCNTGTEDCDDDCVIGGPELQARCKEYTLDICQTVGFTVREKTWRRLKLSKEEVVAKAMMKKMKVLDEYLAQTMVSRLNAFAGVNQFAGIGTVAGDGNTYILPSFWTADIMGYFTQVAIMNKLSGGYMLHGNNLWNVNWAANYNNLNADQKSQIAKMNALENFWDPFNVDSVNSPEKASYMISKGAVAFFSKAYYPSTPVEYIGAGQTRYSVQSKSLPGVFYDVVYTNRCLNNEIYHDFSLYVTAGIFNNPYGCNDEVTGVLKFICGDASAAS